jgi:hypothetical protein
MYVDGSWEDLLAALPRRSRQAIGAQANALNLRRAGREQWKTHEIKLLQEIYPTTMPIREIVSRLAPHTMISIHKRAADLGLKRPTYGLIHFHPGWERMRALLEARGPLTQSQIAEALHITESAVAKLRETNASNLRISDYIPPRHTGRWTPLIGLSDGRPDAPKPFRSSKSRVGRKIANPFATAAGFVQPITVVAPVRIFQQSMDVDEWEKTGRRAA